MQPNDTKPEMTLKDIDEITGKMYTSPSSMSLFIGLSNGDKIHLDYWHVNHNNPNEIDNLLRTEIHKYKLREASNLKERLAKQEADAKEKARLAKFDIEKSIYSVMTGPNITIGHMQSLQLV